MSASAVVIHYEEALYQVYGHFSLRINGHFSRWTWVSQFC